MYSILQVLTCKIKETADVLAAAAVEEEMEQVTAAAA